MSLKGVFYGPASGAGRLSQSLHRIRYHGDLEAVLGPRVIERKVGTASPARQAGQGEPPRRACPLPTAFPAAVSRGGPGRPPGRPARLVPPRPTWVYGPLPAGSMARVAHAALAHHDSARTLQPPGPAAPPRRVPDDVTEAGRAVLTGAGWGRATSKSLSLFFLSLLLPSPWSLPPLYTQD